MIRPRAGNFVYSATEFQEMKDDLVRFKALGLADGFVFGILDGKGRVDVQRCKELVELAGDKPCTFHRAFDQIADEDMEGALGDVVGCGFNTLLTSGGEADAVKGWERSKELVERAGGRIEIMPGGGVRSGNLEVLRGTGAEWYHSSGIVEGGDGCGGDESEMRRMVDVLKDG
jgi:copper homeostasis protein